MTVNRRAVLAASVLSCAVSPAALAQSDADAQTDDDVGLYGKVSIGVAAVTDADQSQTVAPAGGAATAIPGRESVFDNSLAIGGAVGFKYPSGFRTELEYRFTSNAYESVDIDGVTTAVVQPPIDDDVNAHILMSNVIYDFDNDTRFTPFIGVGVGGARVTNFMDTGFDAASDWAFAYQAKAGLTYDLSPTLKLSAEINYLRTRDLEFQATDPAGATLTIGGAPYVQSTALISLIKAF
ncbi:MAG: outer membrane beta-barrel protein [Pseudomonadota bacterium]